MKNKKQAYELVEAICKINEKQWRNPKGSYDDVTEAAYQIEEALEGFTDYSYLANKLGRNVQWEVTPGPKELSRMIASFVSNSDNKQLSNRDRMDKALDSVYYAIGSLHKLGLNPSDIVEGLQVVHEANLAKSGDKDSEGKVIKQSNFILKRDKISKNK